MGACKDCICEYASKFVKNKWDELDKNELNIEQDKEDFARLVKDEYEIASWVITELMVWGANKDYLEQMKVQENDNGFVAKFSEDTYIKFTLVHFDWMVKFVEPKTYFE